jgi:hypothetical protein
MTAPGGCPACCSGQHECLRNNLGRKAALASHSIVHPRSLANDCHWGRNVVSPLTRVCRTLLATGESRPACRCGIVSACESTARYRFPLRTLFLTQTIGVPGTSPGAR